MICPACNTHITKIPVNWKCPHCSERLPEPTKWELFKEAFIEWLQEKGTLFYSIWLFLLLVVIGAVELFFGHTYLLAYFGANPLIAILSVFFGGMLIDMVMKINLPIKLPQGADFLIKERKQIRNIRKATNGAILIGLLYALIYAGPMGFLLYFNSYVLIIGWWLAMAWSITGLFIDPRLMEDIRIRYFMDERLGIISLKRYRKLGTIMIGMLIVIAILFNVLMATSGIWLKLSNVPVVGNMINFGKAYFGWLL